jgi:hypothetical protein
MPGPKPIMIMGRVSQTAAAAALGLLVLGFMFHAAGLRVNVPEAFQWVCIA